jgi:hypothetical protein
MENQQMRPNGAQSGASNMSWLRSRDHAQANDAMEVFSKLEGEIRELVSRDSTPLGLRQGNVLQQGNVNELAAGHIGSMLQDVSGTSVQEIEKLIAELRILRDRLQKEAARVQREIVGYAGLIQDARRSAATISGSLGFWRNDRDDTPRISA